MNRIVTLPNCKGYKNFKEKILAIDKKGLKVFENQFSLLIELKIENLYSLEVLSDTLAVFSKSKPYESYFLNDNLKMIKTTTSLSLNGKFYKDFFYCLSINEGKKGYVKLDRSSGDVVNFWKSPISINGIYEVVGNDNIISKKKSVIVSYNLETKIEHWRKNFASLERNKQAGNILKTYIHKKEEVLVVLLTNGKVIGINLKNGQELWQQEVNLYSSELTQYKNILYHIELGSSPHCLIKMDIKTGEILEKIKLNDPIFKTVFTQKFIDEKYIAMTAKIKGMIVVLDKNTGEVLIKEKLPESCKNGIPHLNAPKIHQNKLYQLDGDGNLYVYEMDS